MWEKIKELVGSIRFWMVTLTAVLSVLQVYSTGSPELVNLLDIVKAYLIAVTTIGTFDSVAMKFGASMAKK